MNRKSYLSLILAMLFAANSYAFQDSEEDALMRAFGDEHFISIATGSNQPISLAPAVASVITAKDIKDMGARDLDEVLESIPGMHVSVSPRGYLPLYTMRGIYSENNPQVLVLINDIPITNLYTGNRSELWGGMPINDIARIEVIRGPGSALYGADAFAGTINIITKTSEDIGGTEYGARAGSFDTIEGWILHGGSWKEFNYSMSFQILTSDGHKEIIESDAQTIYDGLFNTNASYAPGPVNLNKESVDARMDISHGKFRFRFGYQGRRDLGAGAGVALALDPAARGDSDRFNADLTYNTMLSQHWDITGLLSYFDTSAEPDLVLYPPGAFGGAYPEGMIAQPYVYERHARAGFSAFYHGFTDHSIRMGIGAIKGDMYKIRESKNFDSNGLPLGSVIDVSNDPNNVFIQPHDRVIYYAFIQDQWDIATSWNLTSGVRYDHYSDFGDTTNPRVALVWQTSQNLTTKALYGRAFRAPAFNELYNINNPVAQGNENLQPETIDTYEIAFNYRNSNALQTGINIFHYKMDDVIRFVPPTFQAENIGKINGHGVEIEAKYDVTSRIGIIGNYAFQNATDEETDSDIANAPQHQIYLRGNWNIVSNWVMNAQLNWVGDRKRDPGDPRSTIDDYLITDLALRYRANASPWEFALSARNIFDEGAREPSPRLLFPAGIPLIPNDLPLAGRNYYAEVVFHHDTILRGN